MTEEIFTAPGPRSGALPLGRLVWPGLVAATIFLASTRSHLATPVTFSHMDKVVHTLVYGLMATLVVRVFFHSRHPVRSAWVAVIAVSLYGVSDEFHQSFTPGREVDVFDWIADTGGAMLAVVLYTLWPVYRRVLEWPLWGRERDRQRSGIAPAGASAVSPGPE